MGTYRKYLLFLSLSLIPAISYAQVSQIVFITEPETVKSGEISGTITVQLQDSSGNSTPSAETVDVEFLSTSISGEFLGPSSANPVTKTISTGSANKNFRYKDSTEGTFVITVNTKGRTSGTTLTATQDITISNSIATSTPSTNSGQTTTTTEQNSVPIVVYNQNTPGSVTISTHYTAAPLTNIEPDVKFAVGAGRDRLGTVGAPMEFKAEVSRNPSKQTIFKWNFGDGTTKNGETVNHAYVYPGEYVVVLNASGPDGQAVSRTNVRVVTAELSITSASSERVDITNNSKSEVNLYGRAIVAGSRIFIIPQDTIIKPGQKISFSNNVTGLNSVGLTDASLIVAGTQVNLREMEKVISNHKEQKLEQIAEIKKQIGLLQTQLAIMSQNNSLAKASVAETEEIAVEPIELENTESQTATAVKSVTWLEILKRFFLRTD